MAAMVELSFQGWVCREKKKGKEKPQPRHYQIRLLHLGYQRITILKEG